MNMNMSEKKGSLIFFLTGLLCSLSLVSTLFAKEVSFLPAQSYAVGMRPMSIVVGDFNGDEIQDLAVANWISNNVSILLGNGDGTFKEAQNFEVGSRPESVAIGDFNGDKIPDLATANSGSNTVSVLLGNGDGTFASAQDVKAGVGPSSVAVGDFDGDGIQDLAVTNLGVFPDPGTVSILLGNGDGTFHSAHEFEVGSSPLAAMAVAVGDFDGDDVEDLAVVNYSVLIFLGNGDGTFHASQRSLGLSRSLSVAVGDFNEDGHQDLAVGSLDPLIGPYGAVSISLGNGDGTFQEAQPVWTVTLPESVVVVVVGDFNGDDHADLAVAGNNANRVSILLGRGNGTFRSAQDFGVGNGPRSVAVGDFNGDGRPDLAVANAGSNNVSILINDTPLRQQDLASH